MTTNSKKTVSLLAVGAAVLAFASVGATTSMAAAPDVFSVTTLTTDNAVFIDANTDAGDDDGMYGVTGTKFLFSGDDNTIAYDLLDLGNPYVTDVDNATDQNNWLFSDLKTQTSYLFDALDTDADPDTLAFDISGIQPLDQTGDIDGAVIPLSEVVTIDNDADDCTIFASGYGRVAIWDGCAGVIYDIELPSGEVTTVTGAALFTDYDLTVPLALDNYETNNNVSQIGVVEYDGTQLRILAVAGDGDGDTVGIYRYSVQDSTVVPTEVLSFNGEDPDIWKFTMSPATNQWCSGAESGWDTISDAGEDELAFCAGATFAIGAAAPAPAPGLAATGTDLAGYLAAGGAVLLAGVALILFTRRRAAQG
ncbi:MAG: LPXTG cell wall anchor domain-containing protein [Salinibacterium sp.]|nr:LPXTG cell wall anchor domain-containing protein [Salinibacterium sp.]